MLGAVRPSSTYVFSLSLRQMEAGASVLGLKAAGSRPDTNCWLTLFRERALVNWIGLAALAICLHMLLPRFLQLSPAVAGGGQSEVSFERTHKAGAVTIAHRVCDLLDWHAARYQHFCRCL